MIKLNLIGEQFGRLTVVSDGYIENHKHYWKCKCSCGNYKYITTSHLRSGQTNSCGCIRKELAKRKKYVDISGQRFGRLVVKSLAHTDGNNAYWNCVCDCGKEIVVKAGSLRSGHTKSCGCYHSDQCSVDLTNKRFGRLVAKFVSGRDSHPNVIWHCKCDCGNEVDVIASALLSGNKRSCGCLKKPYSDLSGGTYNNLFVESVDHVDSGGRYFYKCKCLLCGNSIVVQGSSVKRGDTKSCGCVAIQYSGSTMENDLLNNIRLNYYGNIELHTKPLDGKEIDIYLPELKLGIEYNGSAYHASENAIYTNKDKHYHRDKFLLAKSKGIRLLSIFDVDYERYKDEILNFIKDIITNNEKHYIPTKEFEYTNNDFDDGEWLREFGYEPIEQLEPISYTHSRGYVVYRSGTTIWRK